MHFLTTLLFSCFSLKPYFKILLFLRSFVFHYYCYFYHNNITIISSFYYFKNTFKTIIISSIICSLFLLLLYNIIEDIYMYLLLLLTSQLCISLFIHSFNQYTSYMIDSFWFWRPFNFASFSLFCFGSIILAWPAQFALRIVSALLFHSDSVCFSFLSLTLPGGI